MDVYNELVNGMYEYENRLKSLRLGYETSIHDVEVNQTFPCKPPDQYQSLFDCWLQLLLHEQISIESGETKVVSTCCIIMPNHGWNLTTLSSPTLPLIFQEQNVKNRDESFRLCVTITNITNENKNLPRGLCIGYLHMK